MHFTRWSGDDDAVANLITSCQARELHNARCISWRGDARAWVWQIASRRHCNNFMRSANESENPTWRPPARPPESLRAPCPGRRRPEKQLPTHKSEGPMPHIASNAHQAAAAGTTHYANLGPSVNTKRFQPWFLVFIVSATNGFELHMHHQLFGNIWLMSGPRW
jgi:hypothetical protein